MKIISAIVLGLYITIVTFSTAACYLFVARLIIPAIRNRRFSFDSYALGLATVFSLAAHAIENAYYGLIGWWPDVFGWLNNELWLVGAWRLMILAGCVFAITALRNAHAESGESASVVALAAALATIIGALAALAMGLV